MTDPVVVALIAAGATVTAAIIAAMVKILRKKEEPKPAQSIGPVVQNSSGVAIATQGGTVIQQNASPAQFDEVNKNLEHIREVLREHLPAISAAQLKNVQEVDAMVHPNNWRPLPVALFVFPKPPAGNDEAFVQSVVGGVLVRYLGYAAVLASQEKYRRSIININLLQTAGDDDLQFHFVTNDGALLRELKELFARKQTEKTLKEIASVLGEWDYAKKFAFVRGCSLEVTLEPDQRLFSFRNAPIYEGEDTDSRTILAENILTIDEVAARSIQASISKALAFLGRFQLGERAHGSLTISYDLSGQMVYQPHFLRLLYHILDKKLVSFDLFRISIDDPEKWDYMYHKA